MTARDDLRFLSTKDQHHGDFFDVPDRWFQRSRFMTLSTRAQDNTPLVAVNLKYPDPCPIDPTATVHIVHWLANLEIDQRVLRRAFIRNIKEINKRMATIGATKVWGMVPKSATHLTTFLDRVAAAGQCRRIDGATVNIGPFEGRPPKHAYFYIGGGQQVVDFMVGQS